jgi:hypothetical protein
LLDLAIYENGEDCNEETRDEEKDEEEKRGREEMR